MSSGAISGISNGITGTQGNIEQLNSEIAARHNEERLSSIISLPDNNAQINHIFGNREGHLEDTPENRKLFVSLANDKSKYIGRDKYGNSWNADVDSTGAQNWVRYQNGVINEGGRNTVQRVWDNETGYNANPVKRRKKK